MYLIKTKSKATRIWGRFVFNMPKLLICNRGEISKRIQTAAQSLGLDIHLIYEPGDTHHLDTNLRCHLIDDYLDQTAILALAMHHKIDLIHPGYGYLSENGSFAKKVIEQKIGWVGPSPEVIELFGDKFLTKSMAQTLGLPTLKSTNDLKDLDGWQGAIMVKASMGGGGRAMQVASSLAECEAVVSRVKAEAKSIFRDEQIFFEPYLASARHIEVQVLADHSGDVRILGDRDCSIQRRYQKIIEEAPARGLSDELRTAMHDAAYQLAKHTQLSSCATVEFLLDTNTNQFWLMEVNPRIQVEHGVTELVANIDLVGWQLKIAMGHSIDFKQSDVDMHGHAIQARVYTEDPEKAFKPTFGSCLVSDVKPMSKVYWHTSIHAGQKVSQKYDPMIMKVLAWGEDFDSAKNKLITALQNWHMAGVITNRHWLLSALNTLDDQTLPNTSWVGNHRYQPMDEKELAYAAYVAILLNYHHYQKQTGLALGPDWRISGQMSQADAWTVNDVPFTLSYQWQGTHAITLLNGPKVSIAFDSSDQVTLYVGDKPIECQVSHHLNDVWVVSYQGHSMTVQKTPAIKPTQTNNKDNDDLASAMPGTMVMCHVNLGDKVKKGTVVAVIEAMKMHHSIQAPCDLEIVKLNYQEGQHVPMHKKLFEWKAIEYDKLESKCV